MINNLSPSYLCREIRKNNNNHGYKTRNKDNLVLKKIRTKVAQKTINFFGFNLYDHLTRETKNSKDLKSFKRNLRKEMKEIRI